VKTFNESWYRVADQRLALRASVEVRRQMFRGERWHVLHDPFANQFFRLRPAAHEFVARLRPDRTVQEVWEETMRANPDDAPGQEEVIRLLSQLYHANLLRSNVAGDTEKLFERYKKRRSREIRSKFASIMFFRVPLFDPDDFLRRTLGVAKLLIGPAGILLWLAVVAAGIKLAIDNFDGLQTQTDGVLAPSNLPLLYLAMIFIKTIHEFGHGYACRRFGGEVHTMGVMFLIFTPIPYVDATASWAFRSRWQRMFVAGAGMIVELFVAAIAMMIWARTGSGVIHSLAYNVVFIASVSTLLFNLNPLLRFDGYYILSDLLDMPNLHGRSAKFAKHLLERWGFGCRHSKSPVRSRKEAGILGVFFVASNIYKVVLFAGILLFVADRFLILGVIMVVMCAISWVIRPVIKAINYLATSPQLARTRPRAVAVSVSAIAGIVALLWFIPFPYHFRAPGVVQAQDYRQVFAEGSGLLAEVVRPSGSRVSEGDPLLRMENRELELTIKTAESQLAQALVEKQQAWNDPGVAREPIERRVDVIRQSLEHLQQQKDALVLRAPTNGVWISPAVDDFVGLWMQRGVPLGHIVQDEFRFAAVVPQQRAAELFSEGIKGAEVRINGQAERIVAVEGRLVIPAQQEILPSAALGWFMGGEVATSMEDQSGRRAAEPFFEVRADIVPNENVTLAHGVSGKMRFTLQPEPLLPRWLRMLRQLIQERYRI
jgi:putative peptide zinc metalloprotease protein